MTRRHPGATSSMLLAGLATALIGALAPAAAGAAPQEEERQIRREIVVLGPNPVHSRMIHEHLTDRGYLGVELLALTPELREHFGASRLSGVLVARVEEASPAAAAGMAVGDVITSVDGEPVGSTGQLARRVGLRREGDEVELGLVRDRRSLTLRVTLSQSQRRQVEIGQFLWPEHGPRAIGFDPQRIAGGLVVDPDSVERVITIDPETINESVRELLDRLDAESGLPGAARLDLEQRRRLEQRIAELEQRLLDLERQLRQRHQDD